MRILALAILAIATVPRGRAGAAQTYDPSYPVCLHVYGPASYYECRYTSLAQCSAIGLGPRRPVRDQSVFRERVQEPPVRHAKRHRRRLLMLIQFDDLAVHQRHPAVHPAGQLHVVGRDQHRHPGRLDQLHQRIEHVIGGVRIEISGRLVRQQRPRRVGDRARDRHPLLLAAR